MRHLLTFFGSAVLASGAVQSAAAGTIDGGLSQILADQREDQVASILVYLTDQADVEAITLQMDAIRADRQLRHSTVVNALHATAAESQAGLLDYLDQLAADGLVVDYESFWVANLVRVDAMPSAVELIAARDDVATVYFNYGIESIKPVETKTGKSDPGAAGGRAVEVGVEAVRAPEVWAIGFTGEGVLVSTLDTGVDGNHPALASRWRGVADPRYADNPEWAFFDPVTNQTFPFDSGSHGTHTMGSVCGGLPGDEIGVAPGAQWIHCAVIDRVSIPQTVADAILSFQWLLDPNEDPNTVWDVPQVCSNSWGLTTGHGYPPCDETFWVYLDNCEAAGIVMLFSAGNEGTSGLRRPADRATDDYRTCAVAAVDANNPSWPIAGFSSRGPTYCTPDNTAAIKPDIAAPGVDVRSSVPGGGYSYYSGTSMASPHVNGVVALMYEACPDLSVEEIKEIVYLTAYDLGDPGEDNAYGWGMIDAYEAVNMALDWCGPSPPRAYDGYYETPVDVPVTAELVATDYDGGPEPIVYKIVSLPPTGHTLTDVGNDHVITAGELPYTLIDNGNQVLYTPTGGYYGYDSFEFVASDGGQPPDGGDSEIATVTVLVLFDPPTITTEALPEGYLSHDYGPYPLAADQGQPPLEWSLITDEYLESDLGGSEFEFVGVAKGWHADDQSWSYTLPFAFPFFDELHTTVWVCSNGFLDFASSDYDWSNSDSELIANKRIAPMWDDLRTDYGGDIYIDESVSGQVTIRWETETWANGNPCNHSVTLYEEGTIRFHYGTGNDPVSPTVGISLGDGAHYLLSQYNNVGNLGNADSVELLMPLPMPEGLTLNPDGTVEGVPAEMGTFEPRILVTDSLDRSDLKVFTLVINPEEMHGDVDRSGVVDIDDVFAVLAAWGPCDGCLEDVNADGIVNIDDVFGILASWD
ncbi:MAG: S8 family serine peptidase [Phycisphaerales bacterium]|nr:MAG: S8 family serine peptidase [Phycisphaerales bacterium]